jgi:uncharacterized protein involved in exopolysaccharide biosynthesis/Mrp family chromosome partitioning ATPase
MVFVPLVALVVLYLLFATRHFESSASLLVKFGQDARPEVMIEGGQASGLSAEERRGLVQSNLNILESRDLAQALVSDFGVARLYPELAESTADEQRQLNAAVKKFMGSIKASAHSASGTLNIALRHTDATVASEALRRFIDLFIDKQAQVFGNPQSGALADQAQQAYAKLEEANRQLTEFKVANSITSLEEELSMLLQQRGDLAGYMARRPEGAELAGDAAEPAAGAAYTASSARIGASGEGGRFPVLEDIQRRIDELRAREATLLQTYRANSDVVRTLRRNIAAEEQTLEDTVAALNGQIGDLDRQIAEKQAHRSRYEDLTRAVKVSEDAYKTAQDRLMAAQVNDDLNQRKITRISVIQQPVAADKPAYPNKALVLLLGGLVAGMLALAVALLTELMDQTFWRSEQLPAVLRVPVLASFARQKGRPPQLSRQELAALYQSSTGMAPATGCPVVALVSCHGGEGVRTISQALAAYAAEALGQQVLLVDLAAESANRSLLAAAQGRLSAEQAISAQGQLSFAGLAAKGEADVLATALPALQQQFAQLRQRYQLIVFAVPAILAQPGGQVLARLADGAIVVAEAERTRAPVVTQAIAKLGDAGGQVIGTVLNKRNFYIPGWLYSRL